MARATSTAAAPRRAPRPAPAGTKAERRLEVIDRSDRRRRITPTAVLVAVLASALAFGALSVQISLIHRQQRLDGIRSEITKVQLANKELRQKESRLQAPAEILRIARDDLGMVESKPPELVTPRTETVGGPTDTTAPGAAAPGATTTPTDPDAAASDNG